MNNDYVNLNPEDVNDIAILRAMVTHWKEQSAMFESKLKSIQGSLTAEQIQAMNPPRVVELDNTIKEIEKR
jgi:hypothetical protein